MPNTFCRVRSPLLAGLFFLVCLLTGCGSLPPLGDRPVSHWGQAGGDSPIVRLTRNAAIPTGKSGVWPLPASAFAFDARIALIRNASQSVDLQYYLIGDDDVGRGILHELRLAGQRGVRVRLLVDDFYAPGLDGAFAALASTPNVEVRLFNPFAWGRAKGLTRYAALAANFRQLNHRMHNKLFVADGAMAIVGGRNLADEYFFRSKSANFLDMDFALFGKVVSQLGDAFDEYWNSELAYPVAAIVGEESGEREVQLSAIPPWIVKAGATDILAQPSMTDVMAGNAKMRFYVADAFAYSDSPDKAKGDRSTAQRVSVTAKFVQVLKGAKKSVLIFNPYFIPGNRGLAQLRAMREQGLDIRIVTNGMRASDEPLVNLGYTRYRREMLSMGVRIFELDNEGVRDEPALKEAFGPSKGMLHAKLAFMDHDAVLTGSLNLDSRSAAVNTELGVLIRSPEVTQMLLRLWPIEKSPAVREVRLQHGGQGLEWVHRSGEAEQVSTIDPDGGWISKLWLLIQSVFVSEELL